MNEDRRTRGNGLPNRSQVLDGKTPLPPMGDASVPTRGGVPVVKEHEICPLTRQDRGTGVIDDELELIEDQPQQWLQLQGGGHRMGDLEREESSRVRLPPALQALIRARQVRRQSHRMGSQPGLRASRRADADRQE